MLMYKKYKNFVFIFIVLCAGYSTVFAAQEPSKEAADKEFAFVFTEKVNLDEEAYFLKRGINLKFVVDNETTPLMRAVLIRRNDIVKSMLEKKPDLQALDKEGYSAFWYAIFNDNYDLMSLLYDAGADIHLSTIDGTPFRYAKDNQKMNALFFFDKIEKINMIKRCKEWLTLVEIPEKEASSLDL